MRLRIGVAAIVALYGVAGPPAVSGQGMEVVQVALPTPSGPETRSPGGDVLQRPITLYLVNVRLGDALGAIAAAAHLALSYDPNQLPLKSVVSLDAASMPVGDAFRVVLRGTLVEPVVAAGGTRVALRPTVPDRAYGAAYQGTGSIAGRIIDGTLKGSLSQVSVRVEGSALSALTNGEGAYTIAGVAPGTYHVTARRVGYQSLTKDVTVAADQKSTLDFAIVATPTKLDEVVTTAVGQQRRYEVGNTISTINADSITPTAPITSLTDLISSRAPGVTVLETSGMTGAGEAIRIRGISSLVLQSDPILIVDGVRQNNAAGGDISQYIGGFANNTNGMGTHPSPTRLNDIDFNDIATIDILKGPAASTEYGTDAANGVIVITTKHGTAGRPQWRMSAEQTESDMPATFRNNYYSFGHTTDGTNTPIDCALQTGQFFYTAGALATSGGCVVDSVSIENPLNSASRTIFGTGNRGKYDLSVSGGSDAVRYFVSGGLSNERGFIQMPPVFRELNDTANLGLPAAALNANSEQQRSVRVNTAIQLGRTADLTATGSYLSTYQQTPDAASLFFGVFNGLGLDDPAHFWGYDAPSNGGGPPSSPITEMSEIGMQNTDRVTGGLTANWRPTGWFVGHATVGLDHGSQRNTNIDYPLANPLYVSESPALSVTNLTTDVYSVDLRGTATASLTRALRSVTSAGLQIVDTRVAGQSAQAIGITATNLTLNGATNPIVAQIGTRQATMGGYGEEQLSFEDRLFLTGALRIDAGSGFGGAYSTAAYPKASVSWLALDKGPVTLRLRGAFGESGVQPDNGAALQLYSAVASPLPGGGSAEQVNWIGNPNLRPESSTEFEGGADIGAWGNRVSFEITGYSKTTNDALVNLNLGESFGGVAGLTYQENIGEVRNSGVEGTLNVGIVQNRSVTWDVALNGSITHNTLVKLAPGVTAQTTYAFIGLQYRQAVGYPLYGIWAKNATYADANHDGIIEQNEVTLADSVTFQGATIPTREASVSTHLGLFRGAVTLSGLLDYRGGYKIANTEAAYNSNSFVGNSQGENDPRAPLFLQARDVANTQGGFESLDAEDGSFVRVREVALTYALPLSIVHRLRVQNLSITGAVRNLALWTRYTGPDPEVSNAFGINVQATPNTGGFAVNNDIRTDQGAVPLARYWVVRLNLGL